MSRGIPALVPPLALGPPHEIGADAVGGIVPLLQPRSGQGGTDAGDMAVARGPHRQRAAQSGRRAACDSGQGCSELAGPDPEIFCAVQQAANFFLTLPNYLRFS